MIEGADITLWAIPTGKINPLMRRSRMAVKYIRSLEGFVAAAVGKDCVLWAFDTKNNAIGAKNLMEYHGIQSGDIVELFHKKEEQK